MYWSLMTLTTIGERPAPETDLVGRRRACWLHKIMNSYLNPLGTSTTAFIKML